MGVMRYSEMPVLQDALAGRAPEPRALDRADDPADTGDAADQ